MPDNSVDLTFRTDRAGNMVKGKNGEHLINVVQMLFNMVPGTDVENREMGLDVQSKLKSAHEDGYRDAAYEAEITKQFTAYTDIIPVNVLCIFKDHRFIIVMQVSYMGQVFTMDLTANVDELTVLIRTN